MVFVSMTDKREEDVTSPAIPMKEHDDRPPKTISREPSLAEVIGSSSAASTTPFNFVSGQVSANRMNLPFRKKSGILNVLTRGEQKRRIVLKSGEFNVFSPALESKRGRLIKDFFISLLDLNWGWVVFLFAAAFFGSWLFFAVIWYLVAHQHGDFEDYNRQNSTFVPCVAAINDFASCFLFSVETQHTIGYGSRATTEQCPVAIIVMSLQSIVGVLIQAFMAGVVFARFTIPRSRAQTILFSRNAVVSIRNGALHLLVQLTDMRRYSLLEAHVRMIYVHTVETEEGEKVTFHRQDLKCSSEIGTGDEDEEPNDRLFMLWPVVISHKIDSNSPLYTLTPNGLAHSHFEIIVVVEGTTQETGNTIQARTSYRPVEILWGHRFETDHCMNYDNARQKYAIHHTNLNKTTMDSTPRQSAYALDLPRKQGVTAYIKPGNGEKY